MSRRLARTMYAALAALLLVGTSLPAASATAATTANATAEALAPISLIAIGVPYVENFNGLASTGTSSTTPDGWEFAESGTNMNATYAAGTGSVATGDTYSFGALSSAERAFGGLRSGSLVPTIGASFTNNTGSTITGLAIGYDGEMWRAGVLNRGAADRIDFELSTNATSLISGTWTGTDALDFSSPNIAATTNALDGNLATNRTAVSGPVIGLSIPNGATFWIRWTDMEIASSDDGLAVDNFSLTPQSEPIPTNPSGVGAASPSNVAPGGTSLLTVAVTPGANPTSTGLAVSADLTSIGGSATQSFFDNGTNGDATPNDLTFSFSATIPGATASGAKAIPATITDAQARTGSATINLTVSSVVITPGSVVISEVYGGGGNMGATLTNDFIELYNRTASPISLGGWSVQYAAAGGTGAWQVTPLTGTIFPGRNYLIQEAAGTGGTTPLPNPDATGSIAMSGTSGKVSLLSNSTALSGTCPTGPALIDRVGYGAANCAEGTPTGVLSNMTAALRNGGGTIDTDNNLADFTLGTPDPHSGFDAAPSVASSAPANGGVGAKLGANLSVTFSEPVDTSGSWFTISCATSGSHTATVAGGPTSFTLDPDTDFAADESCTLTIVAANITDQDVIDPPDAMAANAVITFQTAETLVCGQPATAINAVQGSGLLSPLAGSVVTVEGVVVGDYQNTTSEFSGFYIQEEASDVDADVATSEGVFVFDQGYADVSPGDVVRVRGGVTESFNLTQVGTLRGFQQCSTGASITATAVSLPVTSLEIHERTEAMLVSFGQTLTATEVFNLGRFGEVSLSGVGRLRNPTAVALPGAPALAVADQNSRSRIILDDGNNQQNIDPTRYPQGGLSASNTLRVGDTLPGLTGVMDFRFGNYRIQPIGAINWTHSNPRTAAPAAVGGNLKVASFNVLNYFNGNGTGVDGVPGGFPTSRGASDLFEFGRQRAKIISALSAINGDIVGLMEIENDPVPNSAIEDLVAGLNARMGAGTYAFINTGVIGTDEIKVALIYKPAAVTPVGTFKIITTAVDPRFIDTLNRPSLAQTFQRTSTGARLTVVVNHLKSKGSDCNAVGDPDLFDGAGNCNITRTNAARALVDWLATDPTASGDPDFLILGDLNSYTFEDPIRHIVSSGYTNLVAQYGGTSAYSYVFNGESGYLDHALASSSLATQATGTTDWHINPDEPTVLDYNVDFKTPNQVITFYDPGPYRASDHDPVVIGLALNAPPTVNAGGPYNVGEGGSVPVTATGFDPDGGALTYAWDLDNNGSFETAGQTVSFSAAGLQAPLSRTIRVRVTDTGGLTAIALATVNVIWNFGGISGGVAERPATNVVKAGSTLAIKFSLGGDQGLDILAAGYPASIEYTCGGALPTDATTPTSGPGLEYSTSTGLYTYVWKTEKSWANQCRTFVLGLADGTRYYVDMSFKK